MPLSVQPRSTIKLGWGRYPAFGVAALVFAALTATRADSDLWGHVRFGLDTLRDRSLTAVDPYSFTQDRPWLNHEWLSELQMGLAYQLGGATGLTLLKAVLASAVFWLVWRGLSGVRLAVRVAVMVLVGLGTIHMTSSLRPQLWTFLGVALLCRALVNDQWRALWWFPVIFALWANMHGGWIVGLGILGVWGGVDTLTTPARARRWVTLVLTCALATIVTPYGWRLWEFLWQTVGLGRADIDEWGPLWGTPVLNWVPWFTGVLGVLWVFRWQGPRRFSTAFVLVMLAVASARVMRIESLFVIAAALLLAPALRAAWPAAPVDLTRNQSRYEPLVALTLFVALAGAAIGLGRRTVSCVPLMAGWAPDPAPVQALKRASSANLITSFNWGQYALWHLGPRLRVSMDGRRETIYTELRLEEYQAIVHGRPEGLAVLAAWRAEYAWLPASSQTTKAWFLANGYRVEF